MVTTAGPADGSAPRRAVRRRAPLVGATAACAALLLTALTACDGSTGPAPSSAPAAHETAPASLGALAARAGKDVGFATGPDLLAIAPLKAVVDAQATLVTPENVMKWQYTEPSQGHFDFSQGDALVAYAQAAGKKVYGHNLVWHSQLAPWVAGLDAAALRPAMENHVRQQAEHFKGKVVAWDVVNEAFDEDGTRRDDSPFQQKLGDGYIEDAFRTAHAADPNAKLCYNDYNIENIGAKSDAVYAMVKDFRSRGVPIDCVGFQSHLVLGGVPQDFVENLERFAALGVDVRITELDIRMATPASDGDLARQADDYRTVFADCLAVAACQGVTIWGVTDKYSWVPTTFPGQGAALVWDDDVQPKPAFEAIAGALRDAPPATPEG
ncbi:endo-1,4-beta-xylanase [Cellulomonas alba]|uniref:Beta-xylanase n=1 Tax=Cellulomonas alba TaxID=3053467 RepID=A0ABT7SD14_9CELL|nr:endo-1,4-beta-xylanase [Cellulomonas alba]MDM7854081.1 endo-1,4-beta-xylanase [Cellulomonas alba]